MMVRFFDTLRAHSSPRTIVLIGPNHFHHGLANVSLSSLPWKTPFGFIETDARIVRKIESAIKLPEDHEAFTGEHSVGVLAPFLKYYFPNARIVPILVDINAQSSRLKELRLALAQLLNDPKVLVLLSMDFSHDSVIQIADSRDDQARQVISAMDLGKIEGLQVDCRRGLWVVLGALKDLGDVRVEIQEHSNSARLMGNSAQPNVTSYFTMFLVSSAHRKTRMRHRLIGSNTRSPEFYRLSQ
jgi:AmmeMemoRadiSam system protein B